jgi:hypothetical protein
MDKKKMTSLIEAIQNTIDTFISSFISDISSEYNLDSNELLEIWNKISKTNGQSPQINISSSLKKPKQVSAYVNFCNHHRIQLKEKNANLSFGEISKELGKMWSKLSVDEQQTYKSNIINNNKNNSSSSIITTTTLNENNLIKKTINELKEICQKYELKKNGNKKQLIDRINEYKNRTSNISSISPPIIRNHEDIDNDQKPYIIYEKEKMKTISKNIENDDDNSSNISLSSQNSSFIDDDDDQYEFELIDD